MTSQKQVAVLRLVLVTMMVNSDTPHGMNEIRVRIARPNVHIVAMKCQIINDMH